MTMLKHEIEENTIQISFGGVITMTKEDVWPNGDAPENPTVKNVIAEIRKDCSSLFDFYDLWSLGDAPECVISVGDNSDELTF